MGNRPSWPALIKLARLNASYSQTEAAVHLPISLPSLRHYEWGLRTVPDDVLEAMINLYGFHNFLKPLGYELQGVSYALETGDQAQYEAPDE